MGVSGIILAGGRSSRMGRDKALLALNRETLIERTIKVLSKVTSEIIIASNSIEKYNITGCVEVPDIYTGMGPLAGIQAGLMAAQHQYAFIVSCDMPFFTADLANFLLDRKSGYDVIVPAIRGRWEPLCAVYSQNCIKAIETCLQVGINQVYQFYPHVKVLSVNEGELQILGNLKNLFYNLNTPEDLSYLLENAAASTNDP